MQLAYLDLETTGLDPSRDVVLEIAVSLADLSSPFDARPAYHAVLRYNADASGALDPFVREMHTKNGLLAECLRGRDDFAKVEEELLALVPEVADRDERPTLAGSSVHFDHAFLRVHMPELAKRFSHRHYDVSAVKLFCRSLGMPKLPRAEAHRAREDVLESIAHARLCAGWLAEEFGSGDQAPDVLLARPDPICGGGSRLPLSRFLEFGTRAHEIHGRPVLRFVVAENPAMPRSEAILVSRDPATGRVVDAVRLRLPEDPEE